MCMRFRRAMIFETIETKLNNTKHVHVYISGSKNGVKQEVDRSHTCYPNFRISFILIFFNFFHHEIISSADHHSSTILSVSCCQSNDGCTVIVSTFEILLKFGSAKALSHFTSPHKKAQCGNSI